jgi:hypothetical protein
MKLEIIKKQLVIKIPIKKLEALLLNKKNMVDETPVVPEEATPEVTPEEVTPETPVEVPTEPTPEIPQ